MNSILSYIEKNPQETLRLIGLDYKELKKLIQTAEQLHHEKQALREGSVGFVGITFIYYQRQQSGGSAYAQSY